MINKVILVGNLGQDPEVRRLESGAVVAKFSVATNETYKDKNGELQKVTEWHNVVVWRGLAEIAEKYFKKGRQVYVEGKLTTRKWQDANGNDRYTTEVVGNTVKMLGARDGASVGGGSFPGAGDEPATPAYNAPATPKVEEVTDTAGDDLPF